MKVEKNNASSTGGILATKADVRIWQRMRDAGVTSRDLPPALQDKVVKKSRKDALGQVKVRRFGGIVDNMASRTLRTFEANVGGKDDVIEKLEAVEEDLSREQKTLLDLLRTNTTRSSLARLCADAKVPPMAVMRLYARGAVELGKVEAAVEAHRNLPSLIKDLYKHALDRTNVCKYCGGTKFLRKHNNSKKEDVPCSYCEGTGEHIIISKHKEFAAAKLLEATKMIGEKGPGISITQQVGVKVNGSGGASFAERILASSDEVLFAKKPTIVDAEVVPSQSNS